MKDILKVGDKIQYSFEEDYEGMDIIETLNKNEQTDCLIVGSGIVGLTTAYLLAK